MLRVTVEDLGEVVILHCRGRMVRGHETSLLCAGVRQHGRDVIVDLSGVDAIDASGISVLITLQAAGIYFRLMDPNKQVREVLTVTRLESVFEICDSQSAAKLVGQCMAGSSP